MPEKDHGQLEAQPNPFSSAEAMEALSNQQLSEKPEEADAARIALLEERITGLKGYLEHQRESEERKGAHPERDQSIAADEEILASLEQELTLRREAYDRLQRANEAKAVLGLSTPTPEDRLVISQMERRDRERHGQLRDKAEELASHNPIYKQGKEQ